MEFSSIAVLCIVILLLQILVSIVQLILPSIPLALKPQKNDSW